MSESVVNEKKMMSLFKTKEETANFVPDWLSLTGDKESMI